MCIAGARPCNSLPVEMHAQHARVNHTSARTLVPVCASKHNVHANMVHDTILLNAVRIARAECEVSVARLKSTLRKNGVPEPANLCNACAQWCKLESAMMNKLEVQLQRDSSGDDSHLQTHDS